MDGEAWHEEIVVPAGHGRSLAVREATCW